MKPDLERRRANLPRPTYPDDLPVAERRAEIADAIAANQVLIVCGETGSGKTTQLPKICLELGRGVAGLIGHTQPRRIAARTVAARIASELKSPLGLRGLQVVFRTGSRPTPTSSSGPRDPARGDAGDRMLRAYEHAHHRRSPRAQPNIDFLLGYVSACSPKRPDLKVIVTSATIDAERFARHSAGRR